MTSPIEIDWSVPPRGFDQIAADLRALRVAAGNPTFAEIARRISAARARRGLPPAEQRVPVSTLHDSFRDGRRRMDEDATGEIVRALGLDESLLPRWIERVRAARVAADGAGVVTAWDRMPPVTTAFVGRATEQARALESLRDGRPVWISAMPGAGKSQLASRIAATCAAEGAATIFVDLRGHRHDAPPVHPSAAQRAILRAQAEPDDPADDTAARAKRLARLLRTSGALLVLDDAHDPAQVLAILGDVPAGRVIVTSREAPKGDDATWTHIALRGLDAGETAQLLAAHSSTGVAAIAPGDAERLTTACGGLPLALTLVAQRLLSHADWTLADHIDLMQHRIAESVIDGALRAELDLSYADLSPTTARLLRACADVPLGEVDDRAAALLLDASAEEARTAARLLTDRHLAMAGPAGGLVLHSLVRAYAREKAESTDAPAMRHAAFARVAESLVDGIWAAYAAIAAAHGDSPRPTTLNYSVFSGSADEAHTWLDRTVADAFAVAMDAPRRGQPEILFRISEGLSWWMNLTGRHPAALTLHEAAADHAARTGDLDALAMASLDAGQLLIHADNPARALGHFARARHVIGAGAPLSDPGILGVLRNMESMVLFRQGRGDDAITGLRWAVALHEQHGEDNRMLSALSNLSVVLHHVGDYEAEAVVLEKGVRRASEANSLLFRTYFLANRAEWGAVTGRLDDAAADALAAIALAEQIGVPYLVVSALVTQGEVVRRRGDATRAAEIAMRAWELAQSTGQALTSAEVLLLRARIAVDADDQSGADEHLTAAEGLFAIDGDHALRGETWLIRSTLTEDPRQRDLLRERAVDAFERAGARRRAEELRSTVAERG